MVLRRYTQNDVIFPTVLSPLSLSLSLLPSFSALIILFLFFSLPNAISLDWIAPWPQAPVAMWRCIFSLLSLPPDSFPFPYTDYSGVEVVWLMSSNPISQCSLPSPAGGFSHAIQQDQSEWPPLCLLITVSKTHLQITQRPLPQEHPPPATRLHNTSNYSQNWNNNKDLELQHFWFLVPSPPDSLSNKTSFYYFVCFWSVIAVTLFLVIVHFL